MIILVNPFPISIKLTVIPIGGTICGIILCLGEEGDESDLPLAEKERDYVYTIIGSLIIPRRRRRRRYYFR